MDISEWISLILQPHHRLPAGHSSTRSGTIYFFLFAANAIDLKIWEEHIMRSLTIHPLQLARNVRSLTEEHLLTRRNNLQAGKISEWAPSPFITFKLREIDSNNNFKL